MFSITAFLFVISAAISHLLHISIIIKHEVPSNENTSMPDKSKMNFVFNAFSHPWVKHKSVCIYTITSVAKLKWASRSKADLCPGRETVCIIHSLIQRREIRSCHLSLHHVRVTISARKSEIEPWEKTNTHIQWQPGKNTLSCQNWRRKKTRCVELC